MSILDEIREIIRAEVTKADPIEGARGPLELIVESSILYTKADGKLIITVVDEAGEPRPDRTIPDVIADFRSKHPTLFRTASVSEPAAPSVEPIGRMAVAVGPDHSPDPGPSVLAVSGGVDNAVQTPPPAQHVRDWLLLEGMRGLTSTQVGPRLTAAEIPRELGDRSLPGPDRNARSEGTVPRAPRVNEGALHAMQRTLHLDAAPLRLRPGHVLAASVGILMLALGCTFLYDLLLSWNTPEPQAGTALASQSPAPASQAPSHTSTVPAVAPASAASVLAVPPAAARPADPLPEGGLRGMPEVIDTATLSIGGKLAPLFGVQWVRGAGEASDLARYLRGREVTCLPVEGTAEAYRCEVEGQDLSKVVLFNGGGRAKPDATPDLLAAEAHARAARTGLWAKVSQ